MDNEKKTTVGDYDSTNPLNNKPQTGTFGSDPSLNINLPNGSSVSGSLPTPENNPSKVLTSEDISKRRIGDWYVDTLGNTKVVPNSLTDYAIKYTAVAGQSPLGKPSGWDYLNLATSSVGTGLMVGNFLGGYKTPQGRVLTALGTAAAGASGFRRMLDELVDQYNTQEITITPAYNIVEKDDGTKSVFVDASKAATAGFGSGSGVIGLTDTSNTDVSVSDDGTLNIKVSNAFADSDEFGEMVDHLKGLFANGITKEQADSVANEDTGDTVLDQIRQAVKDEENSFYYKASSIANFKRIAPNASDDALEDACATQLIAGAKKGQLDELEIAVYDMDNNKSVVNAKEFVEEFANKSEEERNNYMMTLGDKLKSSEVSDDEKVVLMAQSNALYGLSDNKESGYEGILKESVFDAFLDTELPFIGKINSWIGRKSLETFETDEASRALLSAGSLVADIALYEAAAGKAEGLTRRGAVKLGGAIGVGTKIGGFLSRINEFAPEGPAFAKLAEESWAKYAARSATQMALNVISDAEVDAAEWALHKVSGQDYDFLKNLGNDIILDAVMTYGPSSFYAAVHSGGYRYQKDSKTGAYKLIKETEAQAKKRIGEKILKRTDTDLKLKVAELVWDKNAAISRLSAFVSANHPERKALAQKILRVAAPIRNLAGDEFTKWRNSEDIAPLMKDLLVKIHELTGGKTGSNAGDLIRVVAGKPVLGLSDVDEKYMIARQKRHEFGKKFKGDDKKKMQALKKYDPYIKAVSKERAKKLDALMTSMREISAKSIENLKELGILSEEEYKRLTEAPEYEGKMYLPVWSKERVKQEGSGEYLQGRNVTKKFENEEMMYDVEDSANMLESFVRNINNHFVDIAIQERTNTILEVASLPDSPIQVYEESEGAGVLTDSESLNKYSEEFSKKRQKIEDEVRKTIPTEEEWRAQNKDFVLNSQTGKDIDDLARLREEQKVLKEQRKASRDRARKLWRSGDNVDEMEAEFTRLEEIESKIRENKNRQDSKVFDIREHILTDLKERQSQVDWTLAKLDVNAHYDVMMKDKITEILKDGDWQSKMIDLLCEAIEQVSPYDTTREMVVESRTRDAAEKYRKKIVKDLRKNQGKGKGVRGKIEMAASNTIDTMLKRARGKGLYASSDRGKVDVDKFGSVSSYLSAPDKDHPNTIRFMKNGKRYYVKVDGPGAEALVAELYTPEAVMGKLVKPLNFAAKIKQTLTTAVNSARVLPNLLRDFPRGTVTSGGEILFSTDYMISNSMNNPNYSDEVKQAIQRGFLTAQESVKKSTFTSSIQGPVKDFEKNLIRSSRESTLETPYAQRVLERKYSGKGSFGDRINFLKDSFIHYRASFSQKNFIEKMSILQDVAETYTRNRVMTNAYYGSIRKSAANGELDDKAISDAMENAYFMGREATTNFSRRGRWIENIAKFVPYLSQNFSSLESFRYALLNDPIGVSNSLKVVVGSYTALLWHVLANDDSRRRYYLLTEFDRSNNFIIPISNDTIISVPMDETLAAFMTPYRRILETMNGVDPEAFYLIGLDYIDAISPWDISGFSEGNKFNFWRGIQKLANQNLPTGLLPIAESLAGKDFYYGTNLRVTEEDVAIYNDNYDPTAGDLTRNNKDSRLLRWVADKTHIPQWKLQLYLEEYGGSVGQYVLHEIDKLGNSTGEAVGGKDWMDSVFAPFTVADSDAAANAFYDGINTLKEERKDVIKKIKTLKKEEDVASGDAKEEIKAKRQKVISDYGTKVCDFVDRYLSAYEITGGLSKKQASSVYYLFDIFGGEDNTDAYESDTLEAYYNDKIRSRASKRTTALAARSGLGNYVSSTMTPYHETYGYQALKNSIYGKGADTMAKIATALEDTSDYENSYTKLKSDVTKRLSEMMDAKDYDSYNALAYEYDIMILKAAYPYLQEAGLEESLNNKAVMDYLEDWIKVPTDEMVDAKGRWLSKLPEGTEKGKAYKKRIILKAYGLLED